MTQLQNRILEAAEEQLEKQLTDDNRADYTKIVVAGMTLALDKGPNGILARLKNSKNPVDDCAKGAINMVGMLSKSSRGPMPVKAAIPAAATLMFKALDFCDKTGIVKVTEVELTRATKLFGNIILHTVGMTPERLKTAAQKIHGFTKDPVAMEKLNRAAGVVKDPRASTPTELPQEGEA